MIDHLLQPLVCERFRTDAQYREGHLRVVNTLPERRVLGLHSPEIKQVAKQLSLEGGEAVMPDGIHLICANGAEVIRAFESVPYEYLCYEETVIWGYLINLEKCSLDERLAMLGRYVPVMDNWAVCDSYSAHAKWMARADKVALWAFLERWFRSEREFEVRFAVVVAMSYFLNEEWLDNVFERINSLNFDRIKSKYKTVKGKPKVAQQGTVHGAEPYYIRMGVAWLLATALAKFPDQTRVFVRSSNLPADIVKLYIRKARESFRTRTAYKQQTARATAEGISNCPLCALGHEANRSKIWKLNEMDADHVTAWSRGGATDISNCQMLCKTHNRAKGNR